MSVRGAAQQFLMAQSWPGHVRQLKELLRSTTDGHQDKPIVLEASTFRDSLAWEDRIRRGGEPESIEPATETVTVAPTASPTAEARKRPMDMTREDVEKAVRAAGGVMKRAAELLGCSPTTLREKRREFGL